MRADQQVLFPHHAPDVGGQLRGDLRLLQRSEDALRSRRPASVHLAERDTPEQAMLDHPRRRDHREDVRRAADGVTGAEHTVDHFDALDTVLQRDHRRVRADDGTRALEHRFRAVRLDGEQHDVGRRRSREVLDGVHVHDRLPLGGGPDAQTRRSDRGEMRAARHERDVLTRARELRAEVAAHTARAEHDDAHHHHPRRLKKVTRPAAVATINPSAHR